MSIPAFLSPRKSDLQDLKKSSTARCVILGTVTATVNGSELGGKNGMKNVGLRWVEMV